MDKKQLLAALLAGELTEAEARVKLRGLSFWAMQDEENPELFQVEIRKFAHLVETRQMTAQELEELKPTAAYWVVTAGDEATEFIHDGNRNNYEYR